MINVREVLNAHSYSTTLRELEAKGRAKVRVINAKEISDLIEQSVRQAIAKAQDGEGMKTLVEKSKAEFLELKRQRDAEKAAREGGLLELETARKELASMRDEFQRLHRAEVELGAESARLEESRNLIEALKKERDEARAQAAGASPTGSNELLEKLAAEVAKLQQKMDSPIAGTAAAAAGGAPDALSKKLETLSKGIEERLDKFGRSIGVSSAVDAGEVRYDALFTSAEKLESNIGTVDAKERKGGGVGSTLERLKKLKLGPTKNEAPPADEGKK